MADWDSWILVFLGAGASGFSAVMAWQSWRRQEIRPAVGLSLLAMAAIVLPILFGIFRT